MKDKKILLFIDHFGSGGAQRQLVTIANGLASRGYKVDIAIYYPKYDHYRSLINDDIEVIELTKSRKFDFFLILKLAGLLFKNKYDSAMAFLHTPGFYLELASSICFRKLNLVYSERSAEHFWRGRAAWIMRGLHRTCNAITSNSRSQTKTLKADYPGQRVEYIANAIDQRFFDVDLSSSRLKQRLESKKLVVLSHAAPFKNYRYIALGLIEYKRIFKKDPPTINWYGEVREEAGVEAEMQAVKQILQECGLIDSLMFMGVTKDAPSLLADSFILLHPSKYESSSNSVNEALSVGVPVLVGDISEHLELSQRTSAAAIFELSDPATFAVQLDKLLSIAELEYSSLCHQAREYAYSQHNEAVVLQKYVDVLDVG